MITMNQTSSENFDNQRAFLATCKDLGLGGHGLETPYKDFKCVESGRTIPYFGRDF